MTVPTPRHRPTMIHSGEWWDWHNRSFLLHYYCCRHRRLLVHNHWMVEEEEGGTARNSSRIIQILQRAMLRNGMGLCSGCPLLLLLLMSKDNERLLPAFSPPSLFLWLRNPTMLPPYAMMATACKYVLQKIRHINRFLHFSLYALIYWNNCVAPPMQRVKRSRRWQYYITSCAYHRLCTRTEAAWICIGCRCSAEESAI